MNVLIMTNSTTQTIIVKPKDINGYLLGPGMKVEILNATYGIDGSVEKVVDHREAGYIQYLAKLKCYC